MTKRVRFSDQFTNALPSIGHALVYLPEQESHFFKAFNFLVHSLDTDYHRWNSESMISCSWSRCTNTMYAKFHFKFESKNHQKWAHSSALDFLSLSNLHNRSPRRIHGQYVVIHLRVQKPGYRHKN